VADTRTKEQTSVGLRIAEVGVGVEAADEAVGEEKKEDLEVIKEYLAVSFRQEDANLAINVISAMTLTLIELLTLDYTLYNIIGVPVDRDTQMYA